MSYNKFEKDCFNCPPRPVTPKPRTLTFENCVPVSDTSNTNANVVYLVDTDIDAVLAASFENTGEVGFNVNIILNTGAIPAITVQPGDSITFINDDVREIALYSLVNNQRYHGIFNYQVTYTFDI